MTASDVLAIVALLVSLLVGASQVFLQRREVQVQERIDHLEQARREDEVRARDTADVTGRFESEQREVRFGSGPMTFTDYFFVLENRGPAQAGKVTYEFLGITDESLEDYDGPDLMVDEGEFPLPILDSGTKYRLNAPLSMSDPNRFRVVVKWEDGTGDNAKELFLRVS